MENNTLSFLANTK